MRHNHDTHVVLSYGNVVSMDSKGIFIVWFHINWTRPPTYFPDKYQKQIMIMIKNILNDVRVHRKNEGPIILFGFFLLNSIVFNSPEPVKNNPLSSILQSH